MRLVRSPAATAWATLIACGIGIVMLRAMNRQMVITAPMITSAKIRKLIERLQTIALIVSR